MKSRKRSLGRWNGLTPKRGIARALGGHATPAPTKATDCTIYVNLIPTLHCFHTSCQDEIAAANHRFRSVAARGVAGVELLGGRGSATPTPPASHREALQRLRRRAENSLTRILSDFAVTPADLFKQSPVRLTGGAENDWRLLLGFFAPDDVVWIGGVTDSGLGHQRRFRRAVEWFAESAAPGQYTCPSPFKPGAFSRSKDNVFDGRYLVVESDTLTKQQICAAFGWLRQFLKLRGGRYC